ncbi:DUF3800 domain-containing protein [Leucobacter sp. OH2974_COT-288]|nr:DUF3800 domain-containing protein [Leucobacter sp. OH2974_COT-288]
MLFAYIDEVGEPGAWVAKNHPKFNTSAVFGYAGFVIPEHNVREISRRFVEEKRKLFCEEIGDANPVNFERKGSDLVSPYIWKNYPEQIRVARGLVQEIVKLGGKIFFYVNEKQKGTPRQTGNKSLEREQQALYETVNRLARHASKQDSNILIMMDQVNENQRSRIANDAYKHIFSREEDKESMQRVLEAPMHLDSILSSNIQLADWIAATVSRAIEYQLGVSTKFDWIPQAFQNYYKKVFTNESKLHFWNSTLHDLNHEEIFRVYRPYLHVSGNISVESLRRLDILKAASGNHTKK